MVLGGVAFWRWLVHEGRVLINGISDLIKDTLESSCPFLHVRTQWKEDCCLWARWAGSHQMPSLEALWSWTSQVPEMWEINASCLSHPVHGIFVTAKQDPCDLTCLEKFDSWRWEVGEYKMGETEPAMIFFVQNSTPSCPCWTKKVSTTHKAKFESNFHIYASRIRHFIKDKEKSNRFKIGHKELWPYFPWIAKNKTKQNLKNKTKQKNPKP